MDNQQRSGTIPNVQRLDNFVVDSSESKREKRVKQCYTCKEFLCISEFQVRTDRPHLDYTNNSKFSSSCQACSSLNTKLRFFKITKDEFDNLCEKANNCCEICGIGEEDAKLTNKKTKHFGLYIDHCHSSGKVRGLLCHNCNLIIGQANDNIELLQSSIKYLTR